MGMNYYVIIFSISTLPFQPLSTTQNSHNVSPTSANGDSHFSPPSCEQDMGSTPSFSSPPHSTTSSNNHHTSPLTQQHQTSNNQQDSSCRAKTSSLPIPSETSSNPQPQSQASESTAMLRVAMSHKDSCSINRGPHYKQNGVSQLNPLHHPGSGANDIVDLDSIQGGLECNVDEVSLLRSAYKTK